MFNILDAYRKRRREQLTKEAYLAELEEINAAYSRLFSTDDGRYVLDHLAKMNLAVPVATKGDDLLDIGVKQGRSNLVNEIVQRIEADKVGVNS